MRWPITLCVTTTTFTRLFLAGVRLGLETGGRVQSVKTAV